MATTGWETIGLGAALDDGTGATLRDGGVKIDRMLQELYAGVGTPQTPAELAASATPLYAGFSPWRGVDVRRFGAKGDGVTNDAAALVKAASVGASLYLPPGTYAIGTSLALNVPLILDYGAILAPAAGVTVTLGNQAVMAGPWKIFSASSGGTIKGLIANPDIYPQWWGAKGDGLPGTNGVTNSTSLLTDASASFLATDVGKRIIVCGNNYTAQVTFVGTISAVNSATSVTLSGPVTFTANPASYYYGTDDTASIQAANAFCGQTVNYQGYAANYGNSNASVALSFPARTYLLTAPCQIACGATTATRWRGVGGRAILAIAVPGSTTDAVQFGVGALSVSASMEDLVFDACFCGRDAITFQGMQNPIWRNIDINRSQRDAVAINPSSATWIQQGHFDSVRIQSAGRHFFNVAPNSASFVNELDWNNLYGAFVSVRQAGGTAFNFAANSGMCDSWIVKNFKFGAYWNGNAGYKPLASFVNFEPAAAFFAMVGLKFQTGYCEQSPTNQPLNTLPPVVFGAGAAGRVSFDRFYCSYWGAGSVHSSFDVSGNLVVAAGASRQILATSPYIGFTGTLNFNIAGAGIAREVIGIQAAGGVAFNMLSQGKSAQYNAPTYTITSSVVSGAAILTVNNTSAAPFSFNYSMQEIDCGGGNPTYTTS